MTRVNRRSSSSSAGRPDSGTGSASERASAAPPSVSCGGLLGQRGDVRHDALGRGVDQAAQRVRRKLEGAVFGRHGVGLQKCATRSSRRDARGIHGRQRHLEQGRKGGHRGFVHRAQLREPGRGLGRGAQGNARVRERLAQAHEVGGREAVGVRRDRLAVEHEAHVGDGVARHRERQARLAPALRVHDREQERARVEHRGHRGHPRLVVVLRAVEGEDRKGDVALEQLRRPRLPVLQQVDQGVVALLAGVTPQDLERRRRRSGPRVEQRDRRLAPREGLRQDRQVSDDEREEAEADPRFEDGEEAPHRGVRHHVAEAEREERRAAHVERGQEVVAAVGRRHARARAPLHQPEGDHHAHGPERDDEQEPERAVDHEEVFAPVAARQAPGDGAPRRPAQTVEERRSAASRARRGARAPSSRTRPRA